MSEEISRRGGPSLDGVWCVIPVYNNARTVRDVVCGCLQKVPNVLVVDDGSTDADIPALLRDTGSIVLRHERNRGKGEALKTALRHIRRNGARFMITLDADAQHYPQDLPRFLERLCEERVLIGNRDFDSASVPERSKFGRAFSNLWFRMETGLPALDTQSGYRAYPVEYLSRLVVVSRGYDYEMEVLVRAAWAGLSIEYVPVGVHYPPAHERVSAFHPFRDNLRLSLLHTRLVGRRLLPWPHRRLIERKRKGYFDPGLFRHPSRFLRQLLKEHATPSGLAAAAFVGVFLGVLPLLSVHTLVILYVAGRLHLNKVMAVTIQHICMPPFVPILCIEIGHYLLYGRWLTRVSFQSVFGELGDRVWEWLIGSLIVAPVLAALCAGVVFHAALRVRKKKTSGRKRGNALGFWFFRAAVRCFGMRGAYALLYGVAVHYLLFDAQARRNALCYLRRRFPGSSRPARIGQVYRLFVSQGKHLIDRFCAFSGAARFDLRFENREPFERLVRGRKGFVLLTSHMGNWQIALTALRGIGKTVYLVMRPEDNRAVARSLQIDREDARIKLISPRQELGGAVEIVRALREGAIVSIMGDRSYGADTLGTGFLGDKAYFPYSAFVIAASCNVDVLALMSAKTGIREYTVDFTHFPAPEAPAGRKNRREQAKQQLEGYVRMLEMFLQRYPYQCFLFYDVWSQDKAS